jgi:hypothetical protein
MSYKSELPTPEAEIDKELHSHHEEFKSLPVGDGYVDDTKGRVQTVRNVGASSSSSTEGSIDDRPICTLLLPRVYTVSRPPS